MFIWLKLYSLRDYFDLPSSLKQLVPVILTKSAVHHNENIRVLSLNGISKFLCKLMRTKSEDSIIDERSTHVLPLDSQIPLILMDLFLNCYSTFNTCSNPAHRKQIQQIFISLSESIRRMCKSVHLNSAEVSVILDKNNFKDDNHDSDMLFCLPDTEISLQVLQHFSDCDTMESGDFACHPPSAAMVLYLAKLIQFISSVCRSTMIHARASGQTTSQRIYTNINTYFWPGISYQRAKLLLDIIESALGVLDLAPTGPWNKKCSKWRAEFGKDSLVNLQTLIDNVSMHLNWDFKSVDSLRILFNGFLYLSPDLHSQILSIIYDHWIERKDVLTEVLYPTIIDWACVWCDAPWFSVYPAGANILAFCCINGLWNRSYFRSDIHTWLLDKLKRFLELDEGRSNNFSDNYDLSLFSNKLLHVVKFQSGLGFLLTIDQILSTCLTRLSKNPKNYKPSH
ncbi:unnamed protein product [Heterobilharzia americana]|nr:unnamed protein product [Heterobilharzia americana]